MTIHCTYTAMVVLTLLPQWGGGGTKIKVHLWCYIYANNMVTGTQGMI
jgi:hypothetical protein